jgi:nucleotide-binding universal stress UspA family protein
MRFKQILVPLDFSAHSAKAMDTAIELAKQFEGSIHLLHCYPVYVGAVSPYGIVVPESFDRECRDAATREMQQWAEKVKAAGIEVKTTVTPSAPADAIARAAEELGADLVVMGSRGLTGLKHVLLGSVAERTLRMVRCPVLTVKDGDAA